MSCSAVWLFQYISCYSLSLRIRSGCYSLLPFQYISCYSLSATSIVMRLNHRRFNTSHVTLYHLRSRGFYCRTQRFNTSHVTLYRRYHRCSFFRKEVSIHLMLLFIHHPQLPRHQFFSVSIHLMLLFIMLSDIEYMTSLVVSIHLMLLFIGSLVEMD